MAETITTMISDLPRDMAEEVLSRLPVTSLRGVRFSCKRWNLLTKNRSFTKKHVGEAKAAAKKKQRKEFQVVMMLKYNVYLYSVKLLKDPSIERIGKLVSLDGAERVEISKVFHCDGLLLCVTKDRSRLVVWNPYSGQKRWIKPRSSYKIGDRYALGYEKKDTYSRRSYKVLRFMDGYDRSVDRTVCEFEIYSLSSNSWKVVDVNPDWEIGYLQRGVSLKGNTYWYAQGKHPPASHLPDFLLCFDFTAERFGPCLPLPFHSFRNTVALSSVREKKLAVLFQKSCKYPVEIWISSKIEPNAVSWKKRLLAVDMKPLIGFQFLQRGGSFFVDEKKKVAVVLNVEYRGKSCASCNVAYIIGKNGYFKRVELGGSAPGLHYWPLACSYVPSSVKFKQSCTTRQPEEHSLIS